MEKKVSVIIPTYNRANKIWDSINSVLKQTYSNIEVLVIDDGSTDNTQEVVEAIEDDRVRYVRLSKNKGVSVARNVGAELADTEIIAFNDSDDLWRIDKLEKQMAYWKKHQEYAMIYTAYCMHRPEGDYIVPEQEMMGELEGDIFSWILQRNSVGAPTMLMYRQCFFDCGGFDEQMRSMEDWDFAIRFSRDYRIGYMSEPLVDATFSEGGVSSKVGAYYESRCKMIADYKEDLLALGLFDVVVNDLFQRAQSRNLLEVVKKMLLLYLSEKSGGK